MEISNCSKRKFGGKTKEYQVGIDDHLVEIMNTEIGQKLDMMYWHLDTEETGENYEWR